jgi:hypothetical protein
VLVNQLHDDTTRSDKLMPGGVFRSNGAVFHVAGSSSRDHMPPNSLQGST